MTTSPTPWTEWEDWCAGMYGPGTGTADAAVSLLGDPDAFEEAAREMVREWPTAAAHNLRSMWSGRRAWIGQATCCYSVGASAAETRAAWGTLSNDAQRAANAVATKIIDEHHRSEVDDAQTLFGR